MAFAKAAQAPLKLIDFLASGFDGKLLIRIMALMADWKSDIVHIGLTKFCFYMISYPYTWDLRSYRSFNTAWIEYVFVFGFLCLQTILI